MQGRARNGLRYRYMNDPQGMPGQAMSQAWFDKLFIGADDDFARPTVTSVVKTLVIDGATGPPV